MTLMLVVVEVGRRDEIHFVLMKLIGYNQKSQLEDAVIILKNMLPDLSIY